MIILINYFNNQIKIFDNIKSINDSSDKDYILIDSFDNNIRIPRINVESILIDKISSLVEV